MRLANESFMTFDSLAPNWKHRNTMSISMTATGPEASAFSPGYGTTTTAGRGKRPRPAPLAHAVLATSRGAWIVLALLLMVIVAAGAFGAGAFRSDWRMLLDRPPAPSMNPVVRAASDRQQAGLAEHPEDLAREGLGGLRLGRPRRELLGRDLAGEGEQVAGLVGGQLAASGHAGSPRRCAEERSGGAERRGVLMARRLPAPRRNRPIGQVRGWAQR